MFTQYLLYAAVVVTVLLTLYFAIKESLHPYVPAGPLFTKAELNFYRYLIKVVDNRALVFGKVRIADVIQPKESIKGAKRVTALSKIAQKHFDFVLVNPHTSQILAAIELNDKSHDRKDRVERDKLVRDAMKSSNIPLIEVPAGKTYDLANLFRLIAPSLETLLHPDHPELSHETPALDTNIMQEQPELIELQSAPTHKVQPAILTPEQVLRKSQADLIRANENQQPNVDVLQDVAIPKLLTREAILKIEQENYVAATDMRIPD